MMLRAGFARNPMPRMENRKPEMKNGRASDRFSVFCFVFSVFHSPYPLRHV
jgi:hypothetical protein